jgi:hypothetical protein
MAPMMLRQEQWRCGLILDQRLFKHNTSCALCDDASRNRQDVKALQYAIRVRWVFEGENGLLL